MSLVLAASKGRSELALVETQAEWARQPPPMAPLVVTKHDGRTRILRDDWGMKRAENEGKIVSFSAKAG